MAFHSRRLTAGISRKIKDRRQRKNHRAYFYADIVPLLKPSHPGQERPFRTWLAIMIRDFPNLEHETQFPNRMAQANPEPSSSARKPEDHPQKSAFML